MVTRCLLGFGILSLGKLSFNSTGLDLVLWHRSHHCHREGAAGGGMTGSSPGAVPLSRLAAATTTQGLPAAARRRQLHQLTSPPPTTALRGGRARRRQPAQTHGSSRCAVVRRRMTVAPTAVRRLQSARDSSWAQTRALESSEEGHCSTTVFLCLVALAVLACN